MSTRSHLALIGSVTIIVTMLAVISAQRVFAYEPARSTTAQPRSNP